MAKNLKGGYKIVSLNGLDLVGESLAIAGLYDKLAKSYDKPILVTGIVIDGEKKKNAFVQVEVLDDGIKINDLYGYDLLVEEDGDITVSANPQELPNTADASQGQVLKLDAQKKPVWGDEAEELPSTASASQGNALLLDAEKKPVWGAIAGGTKLYNYSKTYVGEGLAFHIITKKLTSLQNIVSYVGSYIDTFGSAGANRFMVVDVNYTNYKAIISYVNISAFGTILTKEISELTDFTENEF